MAAAAGGTHHAIVIETDTLYGTFQIAPDITYRGLYPILKHIVEYYATIIWTEELGPPIEEPPDTDKLSVALMSYVLVWRFITECIRNRPLLPTTYRNSSRDDGLHDFILSLSRDVEELYYKAAKVSQNKRMVLQQLLQEQRRGVVVGHPDNSKRAAIALLKPLSKSIIHNSRSFSARQRTRFIENEKLIIEDEYEDLKYHFELHKLQHNSLIANFELNCAIKDAYICRLEQIQHQQENDDRQQNQQCQQDQQQRLNNAIKDSYIYKLEQRILSQQRKPESSLSLVEIEDDQRHQDPPIEIEDESNSSSEHVSDSSHGGKHHVNVNGIEIGSNVDSDGNDGVDPDDRDRQFLKESLLRDLNSTTNNRGLAFEDRKDGLMYAISTPQPNGESWGSPLEHRNVSETKVSRCIVCGGTTQGRCSHRRCQDRTLKGRRETGVPACKKFCHQIHQLSPWVDCFPRKNFKAKQLSSKKKPAST